MKRIAIGILMLALLGIYANSNRGKQDDGKYQPLSDTELRSSEVTVVEDEIKSTLKDPYSAKVEIVKVRRKSGETGVCARVNAKNSFGAYTGDKMVSGYLYAGKRFSIVESHGGPTSLIALSEICGP